MPVYGASRETGSPRFIGRLTRYSRRPVFGKPDGRAARGHKGGHQCGKGSGARRWQVLGQRAALDNVIFIVGLELIAATIAAKVDADAVGYGLLGHIGCRAVI